MAKEYKVCTKYQADGQTYFNVDGKPATTTEKAILAELKEECGWPMFLYEGHVEDCNGTVVQI